MKSRGLLLALLLLHAAPLYAAVGTTGVETWYVRPSSACANNGDGLAYGCAAAPGATGAFQGMSNIIYTATTGVDTGDTLYVCGTHSETPLAPPNGWSGVAGTEILVNWDCPADPGLIRSVHTMTEATTGANWTEESPDIWYLSLAGYTWTHPRRVWRDDVEVFAAQAKTDLGTQINGAGPVATWYFDSVGSRLYYYKVGNPATGLTTLKSLVANSGTCSYTNVCLNGSGVTDIKLINPKVEGGNFAAIYLLGPSRITITGTTTDRTNCTIGKDTLRGVLISDTSGNGSGTIAQDITVSNCTIDAVIPSQFTGYTYEWNSSLGNMVHVLDGATRVIIRNNTIKDGVHAQVDTTAVGGTTTITDVLVEGNDLSCRDSVAYCRWFSVDGDTVGDATNIRFIGNRMTNMSIRSQLNGNDNVLRGNLMAGVRADVIWKNGVQGGKNQMIEFEAYAGVSQNNLIENNTMANNPYAPCISWRNSSALNVGHSLKNNLLYNCGSPTYTSQPGGANAAIHKPTGANLGNVSFSNTLVYSTSTATTIGYKGGNYNMSDWEIACTGDTCTGGIAANPLFIDTTDYLPGVLSPARGAGMAYANCIGYLGRICFSPPTIGYYQISSPDGASSRLQ